MHTREVAVQCANSRQTSEAAVQTDIPDIMEDLKEQVKSLTKIVAELTELKATVNTNPLDNLALICQGDIISETPPLLLLRLLQVHLSLSQNRQCIGLFLLQARISPCHSQ